MVSFPSYPIFLWITWCKILFIVSDQFWKTRSRHRAAKNLTKKKHVKSSYCL
ncbi:hypothetical protein [Siccibacter colletis]|uniref:hypothetical protein n=1 Tax=Siccibacter colletis TaxID=1505757 RepID=UPI001F17E3D5|nr:hypothetical protein [Siccibacter colletis]